MPRYKIVEVLNVTETRIYRYEVEADNRLAALEKLRGGDFTSGPKEDGTVGDPDYGDNGFAFDDLGGVDAALTDAPWGDGPSIDDVAEEADAREQE